jgi:hypothetical protein
LEIPQKIGLEAMEVKNMLTNRLQRHHPYGLSAGTLLWGLGQIFWRDNGGELPVPFTARGLGEGDSR